MKVQLKVSIEKVFLIFALFFGMLYIFITPPFQSVDEANHFYRAYSISQGNFIDKNQDGIVGNFLPDGLHRLEEKFLYLNQNPFAKTSIKDFKEAYKIKSEKTVLTGFANTALYSPIPYAVQTSAIAISNSLNFNPLLTFYAVRIFNLILYCFLGYWALRTIPFMRAAVFLILLVPMNLSLAASCSTDVTLLGVSLLFVAKIFEAINKSLTTKNYLLLLVMAFILAMTKHNVFLIPLIFLIPKEKFNGNYILKVSGIFLTSIIPCIIWSKAIEHIYVPLNPDADMYKQINFILNNPLKYLHIIIMTVIFKTLRLIATSVGFLGWQDTRLWFMTYILYPVAIFFSAIYSGINNDFLSKYKKIFVILLAIASYLFISTYLYLAWSPIGNSIIIGLNGKYFTPLLLPVLTVIALLLKNKQHKITSTIIYGMYGFSAIILTSSIISLVCRFYIN